MDTKKAAVFRPIETKSLNYAGGRPYLHSQSEWPESDDGIPLLFLCQIDLSTVPDLGIDLPKEGLLQFYTKNDDLFGLADDVQQGNDLVFYVNDPENTKPTEQPTYHVNSIESPLVELDKETYFSVEEMDMAPLAGDSDCDWEFHLGGYPMFTQNDFRNGKNDVQLLLAWVGTKVAMWGDAGAASYWIAPAYLKNKNFDQTFLYWDCY